MQRRNFIKGGLLASTLSLNSSSATLAPIEFTPISAEERKMRVAKAQKLMAEKQIQAIILDAGINMNYYTGISWYPSERSMLAVIPAKGEINFICPAFEEDRFLEMAPAGTKVSIWEEDENPFALTARVLKEIGLEKGQIGLPLIRKGFRVGCINFTCVGACSLIFMII
jgi:Xaa-Pro dipeptidase